MNRLKLALAVAVFTASPVVCVVPSAAGAAGSGPLRPTSSRPGKAPAVVRTPRRVIPRVSDAIPTGLTAPRSTASGLDPRTSVHVTRVLLILAYWGTTHPAVTPTTAKSVVIDRTNAWYRAASYGHQGISGTVTRWLKIAPQSCADMSVNLVSAAAVAARRAHYNPSAYQRLVVYVPCSPGGVTGVGEVPGNKVVLFAHGLDLSTSVHEQGHNYGLQHANLLDCRLDGHPVTLTRGSSCGAVEYEDVTSAMGYDIGGNGYAGDFTAPEKAGLGWLAGKLRTVSGTATVTLSPYETVTGVKALRVPSSGRYTYWVEYRTPRGNDAHMTPSDYGVMIHAGIPGSAVSQSLLLPMLPSGRDLPGGRVDLPVHSSWTSPEGIRFAVTRAGSGAATIAITRGSSAGRPRAPSAVRAAPGDEAATVSFARAFDNGRPVRSYVVTAHPSGRQAVVSDFSSESRVHATVRGLANGAGTTFTVRARNEMGSSPASSPSAAVVPVAALPSVAIQSPTAGDVQGVVTITASGTPNPTTRRAIANLRILIDGKYVGAISGAKGSYGWDTGLAGAHPGSHTITVVAVDTNNRSARRSVTVNLTHTSAPAVTISAPAADAQVSGQVTISGSVTLYAASPMQSVDLYIGGVWQAAVTSSPWSFGHDFYYDAPGTTRITVVATDALGRRGATSRTITVSHPPPDISAVSPSDNSTVSGSAAIGYSITNHARSEYLDVEYDVDGSYWGSGAPQIVPGGTGVVSYTWSTLAVPAGAHTFTIVVSDDAGYSSTVVLHLTVTHPPPLLTVTAPQDGSSVSGPFSVAGTVTDRSGVDYGLTVTLVIDGYSLGSVYPSDPSGSGVPYDFALDSSQFAAGTHTATVTATDAAGAVAEAVTLTFTTNGA